MRKKRHKTLWKKAYTHKNTVKSREKKHTKRYST